MRVRFAKMSSLFIEKYRPKTREEIVGNKNEIDRLFSIVKTGNIPHCIFEGVPGTGKTTSALVIARQLFGEYYKSNWREFNASDERGIDIIRDDVKTFCTMSPLVSSFKILFLDEADGLTGPAQEALRRMMEKYGGITRFILSCNDISKIIEPLQSRCEIFHFSPLSVDDIFLRLKQVSSIENISIDEESLKILAERAEGDLRKGLNKIQVLASFGIHIDKTVVMKQDKTEESYDTVLGSLKTGRFLETRKACLDMILNGYTERDIIQGLHKSFINDKDLLPVVKGKCILQLAKADYKLTMGVSRGLQLDACLLKILEEMK